MARYTICTSLNSLKSAYSAATLSILLLLNSINSPALAQQNPIATSKVAASLLGKSDEETLQEVRLLPKDKPQFFNWLKKELPHAKPQQSAAKSITLGNLQPGDMAKLQQCPWILYIDRGNRQAKEELELKDSDLAANNITAVHAFYPTLNGTGLSASIKESPFDTTDLDLIGRVLPPTVREAGHSMHATTMATVIAGAGNTSPDATGVAKAAKVSSSSFANLMPDDGAALMERGISVQNHSYGVGVENYYGLESMAYDEQALAYPQLLHVFSSGNSGNKTSGSGPYAGIPGIANLTGQFKTSKNTLSIGALDTERAVGMLSSVGPTYDGRVKPELVAHGVGGTSEAAALVSGVALLVQQAYAEDNGNALPPAALVKAILINSADDVESPHVDFKSGYGNVDALGAVQTVQEQRFFSGSIDSGASATHVLQVPAGIDELKVTLVWHDAPASPEAEAALVNDLDLRLVHTSSGQVWLPWVLSSYPHPDSLGKVATRMPDHLNNVEQITISLPAPGSYELQVNGYEVPQGPQAYSIAYEYTSGLSWTYPSQHGSLKAGQSNRLRWSGQASGTAKLEYKWSNTDNWTLISDAVALNQPYFDWASPDTLALAQLRLTTENQVLLSPEFILAHQTKPAVTLNCDGEQLLEWPAIVGADNYQIYSLQGSYLQPLKTTSDTLAILPGGEEAATYYAVAPVIGNKTATRSQVTAFNGATELCYISNFLPRQPAMETVLFDLTISTDYRVMEVALERWEKNSFKAVATTGDVQQQTIALHDPNPAPGLNRYRARVATAQQVYYSQPEDILYTQKGFIQVAPNPVMAGQDVQVVAHGEGTALLQLYNLSGQLVYTSSDSGTFKTVPTTDLPAGLYLLRLRTEHGEKLSARIVVVR